MLSIMSCNYYNSDIDYPVLYFKNNHFFIVRYLCIVFHLDQNAFILLLALYFAWHLVIPYMNVLAYH